MRSILREKVFNRRASTFEAFGCKNISKNNPRREGKRCNCCGQLTVQTILLFTYGVTRIRANREIFNFHCSKNSSDCLKKGGKLRVSPIGGERYAEASIVTVYLPLVLTPLVVAFEALRLSVRVPFRQLDGPERSNDTRYAIVFRG